MPRNLPWAQKAKSGRAAKKPASPANRVNKRLRSSSPPPEPPSEEFMKDGMANDDKFRMVEDEFLSIAKTFTVHLHAAEYKRQQKLAKTKNEETINSISRPVTGKMPDHTRRKVEAVARAKTQRNILENFPGKKSEDHGLSDSDDDTSLPYVGTTLHGLMDSPRKRAVSLTKLGTVSATTRAAAGFKIPAAQSKSEIKPELESPQSKAAHRLGQSPHVIDDASTESSNDDELDAPIPAPKLPTMDRTTSGRNLQSSLIEARSINSFTGMTKSREGSRVTSSVATKTGTGASFTLPASNTVDTRVKNESNSRLPGVEQARQGRMKLERERQNKKKLNVIPTFL